MGKRLPRPLRSAKNGLRQDQALNGRAERLFLLLQSAPEAVFRARKGHFGAKGSYRPNFWQVFTRNHSFIWVEQAASALPGPTGGVCQPLVESLIQPHSGAKETPSDGDSRTRRLRDRKEAVVSGHRCDDPLDVEIKRPLPIQA